MQPLPIEAQLGAISGVLGPGTTLVLQAPPGAGKTSRVPLHLLDTVGQDGRILLLLSLIHI